MKETFDKDGAPVIQCVVGPCWPMLFVTLGLILGISLAVFFGLFRFTEWYIKGPLLGMLLVTVVSYLWTACRDPGIQRMYDHKVRSDWTYCQQAQTYRKPGAVYDLESQVVVEEIDHFCPWIGTTVAKRNIMCFYVFVGSVCILFAIVCVTAVLAFAIR